MSEAEMKTAVDRAEYWCWVNARSADHLMSENNRLLQEVFRITAELERRRVGEDPLAENEFIWRDRRWKVEDFTESNGVTRAAVKATSNPRNQS